MIIGIGSDIFDISWMKNELARNGDSIKQELFTPAEIEYCQGKRYPERHFAARFAAKEALFKALGTGKGLENLWQDVEVRNDSEGQPYITLDGKTAEVVDSLGVGRIFVTLSHTSSWAMANVILES